MIYHIIYIYLSYMQWLQSRFPTSINLLNLGEIANISHKIDVFTIYFICENCTANNIRLI